MASSPDPAAAPTISKLRSRLIPTTPQKRWDDGELPRAVLHLDDHCVLQECLLLLELVCVQRRCLEDTAAARAVALREVLLELLPETLDHPRCAVCACLPAWSPEAPAADERSASASPAIAWDLPGFRRPRGPYAAASTPSAGRGCSIG